MPPFDPPSRFTATTPLFFVLKDPAGSEYITKVAPDIVNSPLLHTFHSKPVGLVLATEPGLSQSSVKEILDQLATLEPRPLTHPPALPPPSNNYEDANTPLSSATVKYPKEVKQWECFEVEMKGPSKGNPFMDVELNVRFFGPNETCLEGLGFYAGKGIYKARLLVPEAGTWRFEISSNARSLHSLSGEFKATSSKAKGPVRVADTYHFKYSNGERYLPIGTTCYVWTHQPEEVQERTLKSLKASPFNKIRMCLFPKSYTFNTNEPERYPFERTSNGWDSDRFDPVWWDHFESRIHQLNELGIEADLILFHAYDRWGFSTMAPSVRERYMKYVVARLSSFPNVWWSLANEFDLLPHFTEADWELYAQIIQRYDPINHLIGIHNCMQPYDQSRSWITHVSIQRIDVYRTAENVTEWRTKWGKPIVIDECAYEGNIDQGWGNITGEEMTRRFWEGAMRGGYVGHGETYYREDEVLWWAKGGDLHGTSPDRIKFLETIQSKAPGGILEPLKSDWDVPTAGVQGSFEITYFGFNQPLFRRFMVDPEIDWEVDVIDTWNMTIERQKGSFRGRFEVHLPGRPFMAILLRSRKNAT